MRSGMLRGVLGAVLCGLLPASAWAQSPDGFRWKLMDQGRLPSEDVTALAGDDLDNVYYATSKGLTVEDRSGNYRVYVPTGDGEGLTSDSLTCLAIDRYRDVWIGTDGGGVAVYSGGAWRNYDMEGTRGGLPDDGVLSLTIHRDERWVGTRNGFAVLRGAAWTAWSENRIAGRLPHPAVAAIAVDSSGDKWLGTQGGLVRLRGTSGWTRFTADNTEGGLPHSGITALAVDRNDFLWVGTQAGLARRAPDGGWMRFDDSGGPGGERITSIRPGPAEGEIWVAFRGGAARRWNGAWEVFSRDNVPGLLTLFVNDVLPGPGGEVRIATRKGVISRVSAER